MQRKLEARLFALCAIIGAAVLARLLPHPPNFTPLAAMALFAGAHFDRKALAFAVPLVAMLLSDSLLELIAGAGFHGYMPAVYGCFAAVVGLGLALRGRLSPLPVAGAALAAAVVFFVGTNLFVWAASPLYPATPAGLAACFAAALPFFGNTVAGDLIYTGVLFGGFALAQHRFPALRPARSTGS